MAIYTIGFTKKTAQKFYETLKKNKIDVVIDIRLNNNSQLASFSKFPDIEYFLKELLDCAYIHDKRFAPKDSTLKDYKNKDLTWDGYVEEFTETMEERTIGVYIEKYYKKYQEQNICLLCSEPTPEQCHRSLVSVYFKDCYQSDVIHL